MRSFDVQFLERRHSGFDKFGCKSSTSAIYIFSIKSVCNRQGETEIQRQMQIAAIAETSTQGSKISNLGQNFISTENCTPNYPYEPF